MHNKKFSLVLGGGAARGLAHIGVIQRIQELGVVPAEIAGTSIGAVIGAFYAAGYSAEDMHKIVSDTKVLKLLDLDLKNGLLKGGKIMKFLEKYLGDVTFRELKIPLVIVATNIDTGEKVLFREGRVIDAIRASISIPGIFIPYKFSGMHLVDGGIVENLPIRALKNTHPVVAVSVQMSIEKRVRSKKTLLFPNGTLFSNSYGVLRKMVGIMMYQNELHSIEGCSDVLVLRSGRDDIDYYEFHRASEIITDGYSISGSILDYLQNHGHK